jgi:hypothetical protein
MPDYLMSGLYSLVFPKTTVIFLGAENRIRRFIEIILPLFTALRVSDRHIVNCPLQNTFVMFRKQSISLALA